MVLPPVLRTGLLLALMNCACLHALADDRFGCATPVRLALSPNPAFHRDGKGLDADIVAELARRSGCSFELSARTGAQVWEGVQAGEVDMVSNIATTAERRRLTYFVPYLYVRERLIVPLDLGSDVHSLDEFLALPGTRIGVVAGYRHGPYLDGMLRIFGSTGRLREYPDERASVSALANGEVDGLIGHALGLGSLLRDPSLHRRFRAIDMARGPGVARGLMLARARFTAAQSAQWLRLFEDMRMDGTLARIYLGNAPLDVAVALLDNGYRPLSDTQGGK